jgi:hypothetical protein
MSLNIANMVNLKGYADDIPGAIPVVNSSGGQQPSPVYKIPPGIWPFVFLIVGYLGLRMILKD